MLPSNLILDKKVNASYASVIRGEIVPNNGSSGYKLGDKMTIYLPTAPNEILNCANSYLRFQVDYIANGAGSTMRLDTIGAHAFIQKISVKHGANQWELIDDYGDLAKKYIHYFSNIGSNLRKNNALFETKDRLILDCSGNTINTPDVKFVSSGQLIFQNANNATVYTKVYCLPLISILGLLNSNGYLPMMYLSSTPITLEITLVDSIYKVGLCNAQHAINNVNYSGLSQVAFITETIRLNDEAVAMVKSRQSQISGNEVSMPFVGIDSFSFTSGTLANNSKVSISIPAKFSSVKALMTSHRQTGRVGVASYFPYSSVVNGLASYQMRIANTFYPQAPVANLTEMFCEALKCFGSINDAFYQPDVSSAQFTQNDNTAPPVVGANEYYAQVSSGAFLTCLDLESYPSANRDKLFAGADLRNSDIWLNLTYGTIGQTQMTYTTHSFSDKILKMVNGVGYAEY